MTSTDRNPGQVVRALAFTLTCFVLCLAQPLAAEEFTVNTTGDTGDGSLRQEITDSNDGMDLVNTIIFDVDAIAADTEFPLTIGALPDIEQTLTIDGTNPGGLEIVGDGTNLVTIKTNGRLTLKDVAFSAGEVLLESNAILTFDVTGDPIEINGVIADAPLNTGGTLTKIGSGSLVLKGANTFAGGVTISDGILEVSTDTVGSVSSIRTNATLLFSQSTAGSYGGTILGTGSLEKDGTGTLTLNGANTYSGGTIVTAGTLMGNPGPIQGDIAIRSGATLEIVDATGSTMTGSISGAGTFVKSGAGTLVLDPTSGSNSWSEGQVMGGTLREDAAAISGNVNIIPLATLTMLGPPRIPASRFGGPIFSETPPALAWAGPFVRVRALKRPSTTTSASIQIASPTPSDFA